MLTSNTPARITHIDMIGIMVVLPCMAVRMSKTLKLFCIKFLLLHIAVLQHQYRKFYSYIYKGHLINQCVQRQLLTCLNNMSLSGSSPLHV